MIKKEILYIPYVLDEEISKITTYKTAGIVKCVFYPENEDQLLLIYDYLSKSNLPFKVIGNGSNLLIRENCDYIFICTKNMQDSIKIIGENAFISSSTNLSKAFSICSKKGLSGFEQLAGIPATIGGALRMNASCYNTAIMDLVEKIKVYKNGKTQFIKKADIIYSHHYTNLNDCLILSAKFKLKKKKTCEILNEFGKFAKLRGEKQPKGFSCGSVFKNPEGESAGELIESCGLKGKKHNGAEISQKHGNFIINYDKASFDDIIELINICQKEVYEKHHINLETEVEIIK